jgi:Holliday junction resolvasome RuvABC endonuclease subunit
VARITLKEIEENAKKHGWTLVSTSYKNLKTPLKFVCAEGHEIELPYQMVRDDWECPVCALNEFHVAESSDEVLQKKKGTYRILAIDQATHVSGWSIYDDGKPVRFGTFTTRGEKEIERISEVRTWLIQMIAMWNVDFVALEGIQLEKNFGVVVFQTLARLQGALMSAIYELEKPFDIYPVAKWRAFAKVKGRTRVDKKQSARIIIKQKFGITVADDVAESLLIGYYATNQTKHNVKRKIKMVKF